MAAQLAFTNNPALRRALAQALVLVLLALGGWWMLGMDKVEDRARSEEVEMIDIAEPPPPPPEEVQPQPDPIAKVSDQRQAPADTDVDNIPGPTTDAVSPFNPGNPGPPAPNPGTEPTSPPAPPRIIPPSNGNAASRAYAESVSRHIQAYVRRAAALKGETYRFNVSVAVSASGALSVRGVSSLDPSSLADAVREALAGLPSMSSGPPEGKANMITVNIRNT